MTPRSSGPGEDSHSSPGHSRPSGVLKTHYSTSKAFVPAVFQHHARRLSETRKFDLITRRQGYLRAVDLPPVSNRYPAKPADSDSSTLRDHSGPGKRIRSS